jgi:hypothetical protein
MGGLRTRAVIELRQFGAGGTTSMYPEGRCPRRAEVDVKRESMPCGNRLGAIDDWMPVGEQMVSLR